MINVIISKDSNNVITSIESKGHANSASKGKDLVCAAVSAVIIGGLNNIQADENYQCVIKDGYLLIKAIDKQTPHDIVVIETIAVSLKIISESNEKYIKITEN